MRLQVRMNNAKDLKKQVHENSHFVISIKSGALQKQLFILHRTSFFARKLGQTGDAATKAEMCALPFMLGIN